MLSLFYEIFPVLLFFLAFKFYGIYAATCVGIIATFLQTILNRLYFGIWDRKQLITLGIFIFFGGLTIYFHDPIFVKWKPTIVFWLFSAILIISKIFKKDPLLEKMLKKALPDAAEIPKHVWIRLDWMWASFFMILGLLNLWIAYSYSDAAWVNFKFYGISLLMILFSLLQGFYLMKYSPEK